jgi:Cu(I)/Ag(I) efflux system membrane fusion protein
VERPPELRRAAFAAKLASFAKLLVGVAALTAAFWLGSKFSAPERDLQSAVVVDKVTDRGTDVEYWTCSMHPQIRQAKPGNCPICGMELVPVKPSGEVHKTKKVKYACAMMCVPPMDRPGKCPVCGMDMVPVEEYGGEEDAGAPEAENVLSEIALSETARKLAQLQVAPVERRFVAHEIRMVGKVDFDETRRRTLSSRVPGRLDRLYVDYTGVPVRRGDHLVYLYSPELLSAQEELIQSLKALKELQPGALQDVRRVREETLQAARQKLSLWGLTEEQIAETEQRQTPSNHLTIYAPIGGIVTEKRVVEGTYVETGTEIYTITDLTHVWVKLDAYELDLAWVRYGQDVEFTTEAYPGEAFRGTIAFIDPVLNARTRTAKVRVNVPNSDGRLKPEMFVRAVVRSQLTADGKVMYPALAGKWICPMHPEVISDGPESCSQCGMPLESAESLGYAAKTPSEAKPPLVIPATAPLLTGKRAVVYVAQQDRPGRYEGREVVLGPRAGDFYLVREGLAEGELVVSNGNLYLDSAVQILGKRSMMHPETGEPTPTTAPHGSH